SPMAQDFVWRSLGHEAYRQVIGRDLEPPHWSIRLATWKGDVVERAEEYQAAIDGQGRVLRVRHVLPEGSAGAVAGPTPSPKPSSQEVPPEEAVPGASLDEASARTLAHAELRGRFGLNPAALRE